MLLFTEFYVNTIEGYFPALQIDKVFESLLLLSFPTHKRGKQKFILRKMIGEANRSYTRPR